MLVANFMVSTCEDSVVSGSICISNQYEELTKVAMWLEKMAQHFQFSERTAFKLDLVLNEAIPNIISYAYDDDLLHEIMIRIENDEHRVLLEIIDDGLPFNPFNSDLKPEQFSLEAASANGRGIFLIKSFTDTQDYSYHNNQNTIRVTINKTPEASKRSEEILV